MHEWTTRLWKIKWNTPYGGYKSRRGWAKTHPKMTHITALSVLSHRLRIFFSSFFCLLPRRQELRKAHLYLTSTLTVTSRRHTKRKQKKKKGKWWIWKRELVQNRFSRNSENDGAKNLFTRFPITPSSNAQLTNREPVTNSAGSYAGFRTTC